MLTKFAVNIFVFIPIIHISGADYGLDDISNYRLNDDMKRFPVKSPDDLFGFQMPVKTNVMNNNNNNGYNNEENNVFDEYLDESNALRPKRPKKVRKNRIKSHRKPIQRRPMKMIFSQYLSPHLLESDQSYQMNPMDTFDDQYLAQLMPHIISTAEQMAVKEEEVRPYEPVIPASKLLEFFKAQGFYAISDHPYDIKRSSKY